jgi:hypothetical protein
MTTMAMTPIAMIIMMMITMFEAPITLMTPQLLPTVIT